MEYKRRSPRSKKFLFSFLKGLGAVALVILAVVATGLLVRSLLKKDMPVAQKAPIVVALAENEEPEDASSEISGKYYGLCEKNSVHSVADFRKTVQNDAVLSAHFAGFNWESAELGKQDKDVWTFVSYRKGEVIRRTSKPVRLPKGDGYISDGTRIVRTFCCNDYEIAPPPVKVSLAPPLTPVPDERVDGPPRRMINKSEVVAGPPRQLSSGAPSEDSAGAIPEALPKLPPSHPTPTTKPIVTPEPGTLYMLGAGVVAFGLSRLLRRKRTRLHSGE